jgi:hypothetical protein
MILKKVYFFLLYNFIAIYILTKIRGSGKNNYKNHAEILTLEIFLRLTDIKLTIKECQEWKLS